jgi:predicted N-acyltransferase
MTTINVCTADTLYFTITLTFDGRLYTVSSKAREALFEGHQETTEFASLHNAHQSFTVNCAHLMKVEQQNLTNRSVDLDLQEQQISRAWDEDDAYLRDIEDRARRLIDEHRRHA